MRKYILILLVALTAASCATLRAPAKLERLVNRVERNADHYRPYQWDRVNRRYEALVQEYIQNYHYYTVAEKQQAMAAMGRYHGILVDHGIKQGIGFLGGLGSYAGALILNIILSTGISLRTLTLKKEQSRSKELSTR